MSKTQIIAEPGMPQIVITREFDAPPELVYRAHIDPELLTQWLGPRDLTMFVDLFEPRDGGRWRYVHRAADGGEHAFRGVFHGTPSVAAGIVQTWEYEGAPGHVHLELATFEAVDGGTLMSSNAVFLSVAERDALVDSGMESGVHQSMDRLAELLARLP